ncbi:hypothetical protein FIBSPDRAFT_883390 [Athelia psychrophila]|uniref:Uncharacterized protein n=1 Tax=Athelia psychrophila TaxID=1759441 RepID=A0A166UFA8_9AGAM|nr:hypothetical protein FIBSPDRAFT_883390 [Fibularhizoctonia sp. CBS 109695]
MPRGVPPMPPGRGPPIGPSGGGRPMGPSGGRGPPMGPRGGRGPPMGPRGGGPPMIVVGVPMGPVRGMPPGGGPRRDFTAPEFMARYERPALPVAETHTTTQPNWFTCSVTAQVGRDEAVGAATAAWTEGATVPNGGGPYAIVKGNNAGQM